MIAICVPPVAGLCVPGVIARMCTTHSRPMCTTLECGTMLPANWRHDMKRKHMNHIQDIIRRIRLGESERRIAQDMKISRTTVRRYREIAKEKGYLEKTDVQPSEEELEEALGLGVQAARQEIGRA